MFDTKNDWWIHFWQRRMGLICGERFSISKSKEKWISSVPTAKNGHKCRSTCTNEDPFFSWQPCDFANDFLR